MRLRQMTYVARWKEIFEEKCREIATPAEPRLSVDRKRLLADGPFARVSKSGDGLVPQALQAEGGITGA
jgi:hypothetical protein